MGQEVEVLSEQHTFTVDDVMRMVEAGILDADDHVELLDGVLRPMSPQGPAHRSLAVRIHRRLDRLFDGVAHVQGHSNVQLGDRNLPEPDIAVVRGHEDDYFHRLPNGDDVPLIVEISVTSQRRDHDKMRLYARFGIAEYWIIDVPARTLTVCRGPTDEGYARIEMLRPDEEVAVPGTDVRWPVAELLP